MARRTDAHFETVHAGTEPGNFGALGLLDFVCGTTCKHEVDVVDDVQSEAIKHHVRERAEDAVRGALDGVRGKEGDRRAEEEQVEVDDQDDDDDDEEDEDPAV